MKLYISFELVEQIMMTMIGKNLGMNDNNKALVKVVTRARVRFQKPGPKFVFSLLHLY